MADQDFIKKIQEEAIAWGKKQQTEREAFSKKYFQFRITASDNSGVALHTDYRGTFEEAIDSAKVCCQLGFRNIIITNLGAVPPADYLFPC